MTGHRAHHVGLEVLWDYCRACRRTEHVGYLLSLWLCARAPDASASRDVSRLPSRHP